MHLFPVHKVADSVQDILFYLYRLFLPLILSGILSFSSYSTPTSDPHTTWIDSTFPTRLRTQLQNLYSNAPSDTESLTRMPTSSLAQASCQESRDYLDVISANPSTNWVPYFIAPLQTRYNSHTCLL